MMKRVMGVISVRLYSYYIQKGGSLERWGVQVTCMHDYFHYL